jgi:hypothetical protein
VSNIRPAKYRGAGLTIAKNLVLDLRGIAVKVVKKVLGLR